MNQGKLKECFAGVIFSEIFTVKRSTPIGIPGMSVGDAACCGYIFVVVQFALL